MVRSAASVLILTSAARFPLFSKGVDTYRFEYAVFLLNKDIELVCKALA